MTMTAQVAALRIARELASSEMEIDRAVESSAMLLATMARARIDTDATSGSSQVAMMRMAQALSALTDARKGIVQTHSELRKIGQERADIVLPSECPSLSGQVQHEESATKVAA